MTYVMGTAKPALDEELLMHYGVLGMKWGKTRAKAGTADIKAARGRVRSASIKVGTAETKAANIADPTERALAKKNVAAQKTAFLKNPDRVVAARMTRGEKAAALVFTAYTGGLAGAAIVAGTSARSRRIERKQEKAKYDSPEARKALRKAKRTGQ